MCLPEELSGRFSLPKLGACAQAAPGKTGRLQLREGLGRLCCNADPGSMGGPYERPGKTGAGKEDHHYKGQVGPEHGT